ncbi:MAG TPA: DUF5681 domain-containing protein [Terracidiphilus sp.]
MAEQLEPEFAEGDMDAPENTHDNRRLHPEMKAKMWKPGQTGNPGGRPKKKLITEALENLLSEIDPHDKKKRTYARRIAQAMVDQVIKKGSVAAASEIADRVEGKVAMRQEHTGADGGPMVFESLGSREEVEAKIASLLSQAQERKQAQDSLKQEADPTAPPKEAEADTPTGVDIGW